MSATHLPPDWTQLLDDVNRQLEAALVTLDTAAKDAADAAPAGDDRQREWAELWDRLRGLDERARRAQELVDGADHALQQSEADLRQQLAAAEAARRRLAAWAGRAIG